MHATQARKLKSHEKILQSASRLLRKRGIEGASVAEVMKGAELTVGGFYAHFNTKDKLVSEAFRWTARRSTAILEGLPQGGRARLRAFLERYLSPNHRDHAEEGCPVAALAGDFAKGSLELRKAFATELEALAQQRADALSAADLRIERERMLGLMSLYVGGMLLSRATRGTELSDELLAACRTFAEEAL